MSNDSNRIYFHNEIIKIKNNEIRIEVGRFSNSIRIDSYSINDTSELIELISQLKIYARQKNKKYITFADTIIDEDLSIFISQGFELQENKSKSDVNTYLVYTLGEK